MIPYTGSKFNVTFNVKALICFKEDSIRCVDQTVQAMANMANQNQSIEVGTKPIGLNPVLKPRNTINGSKNNKPPVIS